MSELRSTFFLSLVALIVFSLAACSSAPAPSSAPDQASGSGGRLKVGGNTLGGPNDPQEQLQMVVDAWNMVDQEYYDTSAIDYQKMARGAVKGMLDSLGDPHTEYSDPPTTRIAQEDMQGSFDGIGVTVELKDKKLVIGAPMEGSPGAKAGLRPGDVITKIDDRDATKISLVDAVGLIRGPRGTSVRITIQREGEAQPLAFQIVRSEINVVPVKSQMMEGNIAYLKLNQFSEPAAGLVQQKLTELMAAKPKALILDLRNNPGGLLGSAVQIASQFLDGGVLLYAQQRDSDQQEVDAVQGGIATAVPMVVLINEGTASAAEIIAGALQDRGRAVLVGERSFGKTTVQTVHQLSDDSTISITVARWYTPKKQDITAKGLTPDIELHPSDADLKAGRDPQLDRALARARTGN